jgi:hypothetical protein
VFAREALRERPGADPAVVGRLEAELRARHGEEEAPRRRRPAPGADTD